MGRLSYPAPIDVRPFVNTALAGRAREQVDARREVGGSAASAARQAARVSARVWASGIVGRQPVEARNLAQSATIRGTSTGRSRARSTSTRHGYAAVGEQAVQDRLQRHGALAAQVVRLARRGVQVGEIVAAHDVAHVGEVALGGQVADLDRRRAPPQLRLRDLPRKAARGVLVALARDRCG